MVCPCPRWLLMFRMGRQGFTGHWRGNCRTDQGFWPCRLQHIWTLLKSVGSAACRNLEEMQVQEKALWHCTENAWLRNYALGPLKQSRPLLWPGEEATVPQRDGDWELGLILSSSCADFCNQLVINKQQIQTQSPLNNQKGPSKHTTCCILILFKPCLCDLSREKDLGYEMNWEDAPWFWGLLSQRPVVTMGISRKDNAIYWCFTGICSLSAPVNPKELAIGDDSKACINQLCYKPLGGRSQLS